MTKEEAIKFANCLKNNYTIDFNDMADFCDMAIMALEQQPYEEDVQRVVDYLLKPKSKAACDDCVSRQAVAEAIENTIAKYIPTFIGCYEKIPLELAMAIRDVPPVKPTHGTCKDCTKSKIPNGFEGHSIVCSRFGRMAVNPDFYCADFEKRGNSDGSN